jgi:large conductance mechanosensitive channel
MIDLPEHLSPTVAPGAPLGSPDIARPGHEEGDTMIKDFKTFLLRGNVVDLAVGIVIGVAFGAVVTALVADLITPIIAAIIGKPDFSNLTFTINGSVFKYGSFLNALIAFLSIATAVFFFVVQPVNALMARRKTQPDGESETVPCPQCLSEIPREARRCAFCASPLTPAPAA